MHHGDEGISLQSMKMENKYGWTSYTLIPYKYAPAIKADRHKKISKKVQDSMKSGEEFMIMVDKSSEIN